MTPQQEVVVVVVVVVVSTCLLLLSCLVCSQIWLNYVLDDRHFELNELRGTVSICWSRFFIFKKGVCEQHLVWLIHLQ
jgi:hypothetical protein